ncbi:DrmE family protein [uncultured Aquimarina sp.]|uniref:DrmE family protein n=1 Tax=uncultured Aquimarina sp. TaxID=575652 RepID=UPI002636178D|nr:DrmE family protein [uncultured Aquimarina sp.]
MQEIKSYTQELINKAKEYLTKEYHLKALNLSDFKAINFYLMDKAINKEDNLFIESFDKELPALSQFPAVLSVAISLFFKNFCDNHTIYKKGDILQYNKMRFEIKLVKEDSYIVFGGKKGQEFKKTVKHSQIGKYKIINAGLTGRRVKVGFEAYEKFYDLIFNESKNLPSQFKYKSAIIMSKKEFDAELKSQKYVDIDIKKAIPMRWIASSGAESWNHIPIEPMIYCVPDYNTLQTYVLDKGIEIETLIVIGKNKYKNDVSTKIRLALRNEDIPNCIILGSLGFNDEQNQFLKWKWTFPEFEYLEDKAPGEIKAIDIKDVAYQEKIDGFIDYLSSIEKENGMSLLSVKRLRRFLYALVLSKHSHSRTLSQLEYIQHLLKKVASETIEQDFYDLEIYDTEVQQQLVVKIDAIFENFNNNKLNYLEQLNDVDYLIVPKRLVENWKEEFKMKRIKICGLNEFKTLHNSINGSKKVYVLSIYNNGKYYDDVLGFAINSPHRYSFLSYPEEAKVINAYVDKYDNSLITEYQSKNRKVLTGLDFKMKLKEINTDKSLEDIMDGFYKRDNGNEKVYDYESNKQVNYRLQFANDKESLVYDGSKTVLIKKDGKWVKSKTYNVLPGDKVRVYNNLSKERLFNIALQEDSYGRFKEVEEMSKLWKKSLARYFSKRINEDKHYNKERLLSSLKAKGSKITNVVTISKWLNESDKERFPHSNNELKAMKLLMNDEHLNKDFASLLRVKGFYRGLMISLGRDLSDDVMDYIISEGRNKGKMLSKFGKEEINAFVKSAAPERTIESKVITDEDES